jgi:hypothetical protein
MQRFHFSAVPTIAGIRFILRRQPFLIAAFCTTIVVGARWSAQARSEAVQAATAFRHLQPSTIAAALVLSTLAALLSGVAWQRLIVRLGYPCTFRTGLTTYLSAGLGGYLMNGIGPVVGCAASLQAHGVSTRRATLLTIIANVLGFCGVLVWAPIGLLVLSRSAGGRTLPMLGSREPVAGAVALLALATGMLLLLYALARASRTHNRLARLLLGPAPDKEHRAASPLRCRHLLALLPWTSASWVVGACALYVFLSAMHHGTAPALAAVIGSAALASTLGSLACFAPEGIGVSDSALVILLVHTTSVSAADCISAALAMRTLDPLTKLSLLSGQALARSTRSASPRAALRRLARSVEQLPWRRGPAPVFAPTTVYLLPAPAAAEPLRHVALAQSRGVPRAEHWARDRRGEAAALFIELEDHESDLLAEGAPSLLF